MIKVWVKGRWEGDKDRHADDVCYEYPTGVSCTLIPAEYDVALAVVDGFRKEIAWFDGFERAEYSDNGLGSVVEPKEPAHE